MKTSRITLLGAVLGRAVAATLAVIPSLAGEPAERPIRTPPSPPPAARVAVSPTSRVQVEAAQATEASSHRANAPRDSSPASGVRADAALATPAVDRADLLRVERLVRERIYGGLIERPPDGSVRGRRGTSGALVEWIRARDRLALLSPAAPAARGAGLQDQITVPTTGAPTGVLIFRVGW